MMTWRWTTGTLALVLFLFMALFAAAPSNADESVDKSTLLGTPTKTTPDAEAPPTPSEEEPAPAPVLIDWANVTLQNNRESYLAVDDPGGADAASGTAEPMPAPAQPAPAPAEAPPPEDTSAPELATYTVQSGDNLYRIALDQGVSLEALAAINDIRDARLVSVGQVLKIPNPAQPSAATVEATLTSDGTYVVQSGDSLNRIASDFDIAVETILELNDLTGADRLTPGQVLVLSKEEVALSPSPAATTATAETAESEETTTYTVAPGDSPYGIARRFGVRVKTLMDLNGITNPGHLRPGQVLLLSVAATPPPATTPKATAPAKAAASESTIHVVAQGDNPYRVARRFGISVRALMVTNDITDPGDLQIGQQLVIPLPGSTPTPPPATSAATATATTGEATTYIVQAGDIPYRIARHFDISVHALMTANNITDPGDLQIGQQLVIPPPGVTPTPAPAKLPNMVGAVPDNHPFIWPLESRDLSQHYRSGHGGIDIRSPVGSVVVAAATGTVEYAGWNAAGYGYLVVIDHGNDLRTLYAHNSSIKVEVGQRVAQGDLISQSGSTGYSSGPHLHFEIIQDYRPTNPCIYLPGGC